MQEIMTFIQHHIVLNISLLSVLFALILLEFINQKRSAEQVSPAKLIQLMNHSNASVIDVRTATGYTDGHIIGALSMPLETLETNTKKLDKLRANPIIIVCANGIDSVRAASLLTKQHYNARILAGGMKAWREAEMPVVKGQ
jgi:rhodanese-related sulfurtransferase